MTLLGGNCAEVEMIGGKPLMFHVKFGRFAVDCCPVLAAFFLFFKPLAAKIPGTIRKHSGVSGRKLCGAFGNRSRRG